MRKSLILADKLLLLVEKDTLFGLRPDSFMSRPAAEGLNLKKEEVCFYSYGYVG